MEDDDVCVGTSKKQECEKPKIIRGGIGSPTAAAAATKTTTTSDIDVDNKAAVVVGSSPPSHLGVVDKSTTETSEVVRGGIVGQGMTTFSDLVNNNLIAFRFGTVATVTLLTAYGIANTPLFFRYKSVNEIPAKMFTRRKRIRVRLLESLENDQAGQPISLCVRHLSPAGSLLNRELFEMGIKASPSSQIHVQQQGVNNVVGRQRRDEIKVEIAGVSAPPFYASLGGRSGGVGYQRGEWLRRLANEKTMVTLQLLGRRIPETNYSENQQQSTQHQFSNTSGTATITKKRDISEILPEVQSTLGKDESSQRREEEEQVAVCRLYYRPTLFQFFATDIAHQLVRYGHASVESEIFLNNQHTKKSQIIDASTHLNDIRKDVNYLNRMSKLEYGAAKDYYGMWSDATIRQKRRDIVEEVEFQTNATIWQKLWRWIRKG